MDLTACVERPFLLNKDDNSSNQAWRLVDNKSHANRQARRESARLDLNEEVPTISEQYDELDDVRDGKVEAVNDVERQSKPEAPNRLISLNEFIVDKRPKRTRTRSFINVKKPPGDVAMADKERTLQRVTVLESEESDDDFSIISSNEDE